MHASCEGSQKGIGFLCQEIGVHLGSDVQISAMEVRSLFSRYVRIFLFGIPHLFNNYAFLRNTRTTGSRTTWNFHPRILSRKRIRHGCGVIRERFWSSRIITARRVKMISNTTTRTIPFLRRSREEDLDTLLSIRRMCTRSQKHWRAKV